MFQSKKGKIVIAVIAAILLIVAIIVVIHNKADKGSTGSTGTDIVGTWYSNKPDSVTFGKDGSYKFAAWNGGNPWLTNGTYTVDGSTVTLNGTLDGTTTLTIATVDGSTVITGKYNYYSTEDAAKAQIEQGEQQAADDEANLIPNTVNKLLGEWTSLDGTTTCTFTETSFTVHYKGSAAVPEESLYYEYKIVSDTKMAVTENGATNNYSYSLYEKDGVLYLTSPVKSYASTYTKKSTGDTESSSSAALGTSANPNVTDTVISSVKNPDVSDYTAEQAAAVDAALIGTWKGTFDDMPNANSVYWTYTFATDGKYSFFNGETTETGTYTTTHDPNNNYYHSALILTTGSTARTVKFYFSGSDPIRMTTDDQTDPTFAKQ